MVFKSDKQRKAVMAKLKGGTRSSIVPEFKKGDIAFNFKGKPSSRVVVLGNKFTQGNQTFFEAKIVSVRGTLDFPTVVNKTNLRKIKRN